tara:strand:- start:55 stop:678 length:624 start_codon:yes stop_codon:yes gene_type:complete
MLEFLVDLASGYGGGLSAIGLGVLGAYVKFENRNLTKLIMEGSEDIKHERAVKTFESAFKTATRCLGYEIRRIQNDKTLQGRPEDISYRFNAVWLNEWKEMLRSLSGATYKGRPLELYIHSALNDWNAQRETLLDFLIKEMSGVKTPVENLEKFLSGFKHSLEYGSENWLNNGLLHQEEVAIKKPLFKKQEVEKVELEVYEPEQTKA